MIASLDIALGITGQTLFYDAPEGRPSSVTSVTVLRDDDSDEGTAEFTATGTVETNPNTTLDAAAGVETGEPTKIPLTATTGIVRGRRFLVTSATTGEREFVEIERFVSADAAYARSPLLNVYASGDTFQSTRITIPVDAAWVVDDANLSPATRTAPYYRARIQYVVDGVSYVATIFFDLLRIPFRHSVVGPDVDGAFPGWFDRLGPDDRRNQGERVIEEAARLVKTDLIKRGLTDYGQRNSEFLNDLVIQKADCVGLEAAVRNGAVSAAAADRARKDYAAFFDQMIANTTHQADESGAGAKTDNRPIYER